MKFKQLKLVTRTGNLFGRGRRRARKGIANLKTKFPNFDRVTQELGIAGIDISDGGVFEDMFFPYGTSANINSIVDYETSVPLEDIEKHLLKIRDATWLPSPHTIRGTLDTTYAILGEVDWVIHHGHRVPKDEIVGGQTTFTRIRDISGLEELGVDLSPLYRGNIGGILRYKSEEYHPAALVDFIRRSREIADKGVVRQSNLLLSIYDQSSDGRVGYCANLTRSL